MSPRPALRVVHGMVDGGREHAWVERGGFAYDWQMMAHERHAVALLRRPRAAWPAHDLTRPIERRAPATGAVVDHHAPAPPAPQGRQAVVHPVYDRGACLLREVQRTG
jgi:hypothetical protein